MWKLGLFCQRQVLRSAPHRSARADQTRRPREVPTEPQPRHLEKAGYLESGISRSLRASSSMFTSLNVTTLTFFTKRAGRYMSQTHASCIVTSKNASPLSVVGAFKSTELVR